MWLDIKGLTNSGFLCKSIHDVAEMLAVRAMQRLNQFNIFEGGILIGD